MATGKPTSKDIAKAAGVSTATVSYVLNETPGKSISRETRERVLKAAQQLHYIPNSAAKRLKTNRAYCISIRTGSNISSNETHLSLQGIRSCLNPLGYNMLLSAREMEPQHSMASNYIEQCLNGNADGLIYMSLNGDDIPEEQLYILRKNRIPFLTIGCMEDAADIPSITYDYFAAGYKRVEYLAEKGMRKILYIRPEFRSRNEESMEAGFTAAIQKYQGIEAEIRRIEIRNTLAVDYSEGVLVEAEILTPQIRRYFRELVETVDSETAVLCDSFEAQNLVMKYFYQEHLKGKKKQTHPWYERGCGYIFLYHDTAYSGAKMLIGQIEEKIPVQKFSVKPILKIYNEAEDN